MKQPIDLKKTRLKHKKTRKKNKIPAIPLLLSSTTSQAVAAGKAVTKAGQTAGAEVPAVFSWPGFGTRRGKKHARFLQDPI